VGFDLVEVSPIWDSSGRTAITAAAIIREAILAWWAK
jgi:arginase family enzyme